MQTGQIVFRDAVKKAAQATELSAKVRGNLLVIAYGEMVMEFNAGGKASTLAKKINVGRA